VRCHECAAATALARTACSAAFCAAAAAVAAAAAELCRVDVACSNSSCATVHCLSFASGVVACGRWCSGAFRRSNSLLVHWLEAHIVWCGQLSPALWCANSAGLLPYQLRRCCVVLLGLLLLGLLLLCVVRCRESNEIGLHCFTHRLHALAAVAGYVCSVACRCRVC
jgi:hypothetical protein